MNYTFQTSPVISKLKYGNTIKKALIDGTLKKTGRKNVKWHNHAMVKKASDEKRTKRLEQAANLYR